MSIPDLFPKTTKGYKYYEIYNDADAVVAHYETLWETHRQTVTPENIKLLEMTITQLLSLTADEWVKTNKDKNGAIKIYGQIIKLFPNNRKAKKMAKKKIKKLSRD